MSAVKLTDGFFAKNAGWDAVKHARSLVQAGKVLSAEWSPPVLRGVVQEGVTSYRAGLVIKSETDLENLCTCRASREWGTICAHSVAVGLQHLQSQQPAPARTNAPERNPSPAPPPARSPEKCLLRTGTPGVGEPAELHIILPPQLPEAIARGHVMLVFEGRWRGGRAPLNALSKTQPFGFSEQDGAILDRIETLAGETPAMLRLTTRDFASLLPALVGHPAVTLGKSNSVTILADSWTPQVKATLHANGEIELALAETRAPMAVIDGRWVFHSNTLQPLAATGAGLLPGRAPVRLTRLQVPEFLQRDWPALAAGGNIEANFTRESFAFDPLPPRFRLHLTGGLAQLQARLECRYGDRVFAPGPGGESAWMPDPQAPTRYGIRDFSAEQGAWNRLVLAGFAGPDAQGHWELRGQPAVLNFFAREFQRWQREWDVTLEERLERSTAQNLERIKPRFEVTPSGVQWFDLNVSFATEGGERFSAADIQRLIRSGQSHTRLRSGKFAVLDTGAVEEWQETLQDCAPEQHGGVYRIRHEQAGFLAATLGAQPGWTVTAPAAWLERARRESGDARLECPPLGELDSVLRPYQKTGVAWLHFLRRNGFGGILADEMGLGKTLQVLAFLQSQPDAFPTLVICPTSLVFNWAAEAAKFTPRRRVLVLHGPDRDAKFAQIPEHDLIITSYALARRDAERYRSLEFDTVVLDEAQHIKNRQTQNAQAVKAIRARNRLVLTGTPLENSVLDLWSIFDFLMPGYLGNAADFRERYEIPITREKNGPAQERLARRLRPFLLRRLKREVAPELPARIDQAAFCELSSDQRAVYQRILEASRQEVMDAVGAQGLARSRMVVLTALLRLRQVCCDLRLLKLEAGTSESERRLPARREVTQFDERAVLEAGAPTAEDHGANAQSPASEKSSSGKFDLFAELLEEILDGGHRALVFSQFTTMLGLLREHLEAEGVEYCYLDGATVNRGEVVEKFQRGQAPVFLISLKAGGVGLNLTAADTVIHFDPWWNPAVEDQATDRAHRIGQTRVVTSYKLITRGTVEEKILQLQQRKREMIRGTLGEEQLAGALSWEEIQELLAG